MTEGGDGGKSHKVSEETKHIISIKNGYPVRCLELDEIFYSTAEAGRVIGISSSHICDVCNQKRSEAGGLHWEYINSPLPGDTIEEKINYLNKNKWKKRKKPIICLESNIIYDSGTDAAQ